MRLDDTEKPAGEGEAPEQTPGRALVVLATVPRPREASARYQQAAFLAHLLAVKDQHAQTRERRRVAPAEAIAAYRATAGLSAKL